MKTLHKAVRSRVRQHMETNSMYLEEHQARSIATQLAGYGAGDEGDAQARSKWGADGFATVVGECILIAKEIRANEYNAPCKQVAFHAMKVLPQAQQGDGAAGPPGPPTWQQQPIPAAAIPKSRGYSVLEPAAARMRNGAWHRNANGAPLSHPAARVMLHNMLAAVKKSRMRMRSITSPQQVDLRPAKVPQLAYMMMLVESLLEGSWRVNDAGDNFIERLRETCDQIYTWPDTTFYTAQI